MTGAQAVPMTLAEQELATPEARKMTSSLFLVVKIPRSGRDVVRYLKLVTVRQIAQRLGNEGQ